MYILLTLGSIWAEAMESTCQPSVLVLLIQSLVLVKKSLSKAVSPELKFRNVLSFESANYANSGVGALDVLL